MTAPTVVPADPVTTTHISEMLEQFNQFGLELNDNSMYYESTHRPQAVGMATPPEMRKLIAQIGWPRVYLDSLEERLDIEGFRMVAEGGESNLGDERLWSWWQHNNLDEESGLGHIEAFIHGRAYVTIAAPDPSDPLADQDMPVIRVESAATMWAEVDYRTQRVTRAIRVYCDPNGLEPDRVTVYLPDSTIGLVYSEGANVTSEWLVQWRVDHNLGVVPVVPLLNRSRLSERYGRSEITPELRSVTDAAARAMMNMQGAMELMAVPQRVLFGIDKNELPGVADGQTSAYQAYMARILAFSDEGTAQQFSAAELRNFTEVLDQLAKQAATYTGLPPQYLAFQSDNPASAEAIRSSETRLVKKSERKQRIFGGAWEQVMRIAMLIMDNELPAEAHRLETIWRDPATPTFSAKADAIVKLATAVTPDGRPVLPVEQARVELNYSVEQRRQMEGWDQESPRTQLSKLLTPSFSDTNTQE